MYLCFRIKMLLPLSRLLCVMPPLNKHDQCERAVCNIRDAKLMMRRDTHEKKTRTITKKMSPNRASDKQKRKKKIVYANVHKQNREKHTQYRVLISFGRYRKIFIQKTVKN